MQAAAQPGGLVMSAAGGWRRPNDNLRFSTNTINALEDRGLVGGTRERQLSAVAATTDGLRVLATMTAGEA